mmetsp:Transcript_62909/g.109634  ORF Transcript_62909/g.109634 Transcript_62909/m.109634 type:complete len:476 (-) Transcript_62909:105-1532(-)
MTRLLVASIALHSSFSGFVALPCSGRPNETCAAKEASDLDASTTEGMELLQREVRQPHVQRDNSNKARKGEGSARQAAEKGVRATVSFLGCFKDGDKPAFNGGSVQMGNANTVEDCMNHCKGAKYMAIQAGDACSCGNTYRAGSAYERVVDSDCNSDTNGDNPLCSITNWCGGRYRNSIFSIGQASTPAESLGGRHAIVECEKSQRAFTYSDNKCGNLTMNLHDLHQAFKIEQDYWSEEGMKDPWWAVDTQFSHGIPSMEKQTQFYANGLTAARYMQGLLREPRGLGAHWVPQGIAMDLGCGLGRMGHALASLGFDKVLCVDQARTFLEGASRSLEGSAAAGKGVVLKENVAKIQFLQSGPQLLCKVAPASVDFVHSILTLQHMKPMLQVAYIEQLCDVLRVGGAGYFQIPIMINNQGDNDHCNFHTENRDMMMHYTPENEVRYHLEQRGCKVLVAEERDMIGNAGTSFQFVFTK